MPSLRSTRSLDDKKKEQDPDDIDDDMDVEPLEGSEEGIDEDEEEEAETRCICGQLDPPDENGLFIQCEKCQVWQHGYCVTITDDVPEKYWCEKCRPELHTIIVTSEGKISKYLPVMKNNTSSKRTAKKRQTNNNSQSADDQEDSHKRRKERATYNSREDARYEALIQRVMEESKKEVQSDVKLEDEEKASSSNGRNSRISRRRGGSSNDNDENNDENNKSDEGSKNSGSDKDKSRNRDKDSDTNDSTATGNTTATSSTKRKQPVKRTRKAGPNLKTQKEAKESSSSIDFSKPTKPRLPQQRSTVNEMRKRVAAILEFIGRTQIDIANEQKDEEELTKFVEDEKSKENITNLFQNYNGSLELMDSLTRKLLNWEQKFGKYGDK